MYKKLTILMICFSLFASLQAEEESYIFEAKGEFAKELKSLVEKYSKEGKIDAKVYKKEESTNIVNTLFGNDNVNYTSSEAANLYKENCMSCHGENAQKRASIETKPLKNLSKDQIIHRFNQYKIDSTYGGNLKSLMSVPSTSVSTKELTAIVDYIKGNKEDQASSTPEPENNETPSTYLQ